VENRQFLYLNKMQGMASHINELKLEGRAIKMKLMKTSNVAKKHTQFERSWSRIAYFYIIDEELRYIGKYLHLSLNSS